MDPITIIVSAVVAGAAAALHETAAEAVKDAYNGFRALVVRKFGSQGGVETAVEQLDQDPEGTVWQAALEDSLGKAGADKDEEVLAQAQQLLDLLEAEGTSYVATLRGSGAIAQGSGAKAVGERGVMVGGNVGGSIVTGDSNVVGGSSDQAGKDATPADTVEELQAELQTREEYLAALRKRVLLASGSDAAKLDMLIRQEEREILRVQRQIDELMKGET